MLPVPFWVPTPSKTVLDDFRNTFGAQDLKNSQYEMGSHPGCFVVLLKHIDDCESVWTDMRFIGKWRFSQQLPKDKEYVECEECWYNLKHVEKSAQILGGEPYFYIKGYGDFQPLVLMSEDYERGGAIAILNRKRHPCLKVPKLNEIACSVPLNLLRLAPRQIAELRTRLGISQGSISISPHTVIQQNPYSKDAQQSSLATLASPDIIKLFPKLEPKQIESLKRYIRRYIEGTRLGKMEKE